MEKVPFIEELMRVASEAGYKMKSFLVDNDRIEAAFEKEPIENKEIDK